MRYTVAGVLVLLCAIPCIVFGQEAVSVTDKIPDLPAQFLHRIDTRASGLNDKITHQTERYLRRLNKEEDRLRRKLSRHDSAAAANLFTHRSLDYNALMRQLHGGTGSGLAGLPMVSQKEYIPHLDTLKTSLKFLRQDKGNVVNNLDAQQEVTTALSKVSQLQDKIQLTGQIRQMISQRKEEIRQSLGTMTKLPAGLQKSYQGYSREAYYYGAQLKAYKEELNNPDQLTKSALRVLNRSSRYQSFFKTHSELAGLFEQPVSGESLSAKGIAGLQTRSGVQEQLRGKVLAGGPNAQAMVQEKIQSARAALKKLQDKVLQAGGSNSSMDVPDFRPNSQRTKTLWKRLEWGVNLQSLPSNYAFPATSDLGGSLGYKLNDRNSLGVGASYKIGWGRDISHIAISSQGLGLRSFWDMKIKGSFFATGAVEFNYMTPFNSLQQIRSVSSWTRSGLVGVGKTVSVKSRLFSKTKLQLLWDFLSYSQKPRTQAVIFRLGYTL